MATVVIVAVILSGGIAGVTAGILLPAKVPGLELTILERNSEIGGVWHTNVYPGVRCDVPANVYQSTFDSSTKWSTSYAAGAEIKAYWLNLVEKYNVRKYLQLNSEVTRAEWSEEKGKWIVDIVTDGKPRTKETDFLITATGHFSHPRLPDYPGIKDFKGHLRHSSNWDPEFEPKDKVIAVIGNGASGLQVVPPLQKVAKKLLPFCSVTAPQDPEEYYKFRKDLENQFYKRFGGLFKYHERNKAAKKQFEELMAARLKGRTDLLNAIKPDFSPSCRRLTPGPRYLEEITQENVEYVPERIRRFTETGIETIDGKHRELDAVICSTGADISFLAAFPIWANGVDLQASWRPGGAPGFPDSDLGVAAPGFPNFLIVLGPNSTGPAGTLTHSVENQLTYIAKVLRKVLSSGIRTITPSRKATDDFRAYCESCFPRTVLSENCSSWFNGGIIGGRSHGIWPGSGIHVNIVRRDVQWEDFEYTYKSKSGNRFAYFGNGWSKRDVAAAEDPAIDIDLTPYLSKESVTGDVDLRRHHEAWYEV